MTRAMATTSTAPLAVRFAMHGILRATATIPSVPMPKLLEETEIRLELADLARMTPLHKPTRNGVVVEPARSEGVHLSDILRYIAVKSHMLKPGEPLEDEYPLRMALGLAWEWFCFALYPSVCHQPGEIEVDRVFMSPDGFADDIGPQIEEAKATWAKTRS